MLPEIDNTNLNCTLWTFFTVVSLRNASTLWNFYYSPVNMLKMAFRDMNLHFTKEKIVCEFPFLQIVKIYSGYIWSNNRFSLRFGVYTPILRNPESATDKCTVKSVIKGDGWWLPVQLVALQGFLCWNRYFVIRRAKLWMGYNQTGTELLNFYNIW